MMKFEKNENLDSVDRIELVGKEILNEYSSLEINDVIKIASMCDVISESVSVDDIFRRYYYILWIIGRDNLSYYKILSDMIKYCGDGLDIPINQALFHDVLAYSNGDLFSFPDISQYLSKD